MNPLKNSNCLPISSQMAAVRSKEQVAKICPNSGCAQFTFHTEPAWVFQSAVNFHYDKTKLLRKYTGIGNKKKK